MPAGATLYEVLCVLKDVGASIATSEELRKATLEKLAAFDKAREATDKAKLDFSKNSTPLEIFVAAWRKKEAALNELEAARKAELEAQ